MIKVEYDKKTHDLVTCIKGDSVTLLFEMNIMISKLLESFYAHNQELLVLDEITDVVSEFADKHTPKTKGDKTND